MDEAPRAHVLRLLLQPPHLRRVRVAGEHLVDLVGRERVELLHPRDGDGSAAFVATVHELVTDLARAQHEPSDRVPVERLAGAVVEHGMEPVVGERGDGGTGVRHPEVALGREDDERPAHPVLHLPAQRVEVLRRGARVDDPHVVLGAQREEPLHARARVLRTLPFVRVRQQQRERAALTPLVLGRDDELVHHDLRTVDEVAELGLPPDEGVGSAHRVAVLEPQRGVLRQHGVVEHERRLVGREVREREVLGLGVDVDQHTMTLAERAPAGVLPGKADRCPLQHHRAERGRLGERPVDLVLVEGHAVGLQDALELAVHGEALGPAGEPVDHAGEHVARYRGVDLEPVGFGRRPAVGRRRRALVGLLEGPVEALAEVGERGLGLVQRQVAAVDELLGVELAHRAVLVDQGVHAGLGERRLVGLVVAVPPVAHEVDHDVLAERLPEREREPHDPHRGLGVVAVHVEDRRLHHLGDVGRVHARTAGLGSGGESELVVHDEVHGAADLVAGDGREVERLRDHPLPGERGVAVHEHRQDGAASLVVALVLLGAGHALDHGIDRFQMTGVRRECQRELVAARRDVRAGGAEVVLHVAGALGRHRVELALELTEDLSVRLADHIGEHVQAPSMRHAEHRLGDPRVGGFGEQRVEHGDQRLGPFEAEALVPEVLGVKETLERFGRVQALEDAALLLGRHGVVDTLDALLDPRLLIGLLDVHVLQADRARVRVAQHTEDVSQAHHPRAGQAVGRELACEVPDGEAVLADVELGVGPHLFAAQRVEVRNEVTAHPVHVDELLDADDLLVGAGCLARRDVGAPARGLVRHPEAVEHAVVELLLAQQQAVHPAEELAALRALDHTVVVRARERHHSTDGDARQRVGVGALVLGGEADRAHADDETLARHEPWHRRHRADRPRIRDRGRRAREVGGVELARADLADELLVRAEEAREVEPVGRFDVGDQQRATAVVAVHVDREAEVHVLVAHHDRLAVDEAVARVHVRDLGECLHDRVRDEVGEAHLAAAATPAQVVVEDLAVDLEQLRGHDA